MSFEKLISKGNKRMHKEETIREAIRNVWAAATNQGPLKSLMSIPPDKGRDADFILYEAVDELIVLRKTVKQLTFERNAFEAAAKSWEADVERLKAKYEPLEMELSESTNT